MKLQSLIKSLSLGSLGDVEVSHIKLSPKNVRSNDLFICLPDLPEEQAVQQIDMALNRGVACIIKQQGSITDHFQNSQILQVNNVRKILSEMASNYYPSVIDHIIGVTGTCGKTSVTTFIRQLLRGLGYKSSSLGTLGTWVGTEEAKDIPKIITTPPIMHLYYILHYLHSRQVSHLAMEVTSHGLHRHRVDYIPFKVGVFTNFNPSHLDYHKDMTHYYEAKKRFFSEVLEPGTTAVINAREDWSEDIIQMSQMRKLFPLLIGKDIRIEKSELAHKGTELTITFFGEKKYAYLPFPSTFQNENFVFALGALIGLGINIDHLLEQAAHLTSIEGRMECVGQLSNGACVFVDFAHRPETFEKFLQPLSKSGKNIVLVFGCGGGGYKERRAQLGRIAAKYARTIIITDDNARDEDPKEIRQMILVGCPEALEIPDRKLAIVTALKLLKPNDICLIAGRGNEMVQVIGKERIAFHDKDEILKAIAALEKVHAA